ncbi:hypothetical protein [Paenibacillus glucanolyticus]|uniref:hypothetical protein n=1 Tax=Paenibacillus glucanolyticus TaxID=59843 RepID=UPI0013E2D419
MGIDYLEPHLNRLGKDAGRSPIMRPNSITSMGGSLAAEARESANRKANVTVTIYMKQACHEV